MFKYIKASVLTIFLLLLSSTIVGAYEPVIKVPAISNSSSVWNDAVQLEDPSVSSKAIYGSLNETELFDYYTFVATSDGTIDISIGKRLGSGSDTFAPLFAFIYPNTASITDDQDIEDDVVVDDEEQQAPITVPDAQYDAPDGYEVVFSDNLTDILSENYRYGLVAQTYQRSPVQSFDVKKGERYYVGVIDSVSGSGDYVLFLGDEDIYSISNPFSLISNIAVINLGLESSENISWSNYLATLLIIVGLIVALGSVLVIDIHGYLARKSEYWTEATTRSHKITKPLIWIGTSLYALGLYLYFSALQFSGSGLILLVLLAVMILNGAYLSFVVSPHLLSRELDSQSSSILEPKWQKRVTMSFMISAFSWWSSVLLIVLEIVKRG